METPRLKGGPGTALRLNLNQAISLRSNEPPQAPRLAPASRENKAALTLDPVGGEVRADVCHLGRCCLDETATDVVKAMTSSSHFK